MSMNTQSKRRGAFTSTLRLAGALALSLAATLGPTHALAATAKPGTEAVVKTDIGFLDIGPDIRLRHMVVRAAHPKGTVLFLQGFPETLYAWKDIAQSLGRDYEVHAFDWPGYGLSSRPPVDRFSYSPKDYAQVLKAYIDTAGIDKSRLVIYATDIGALPALLLALDDPHIARKIVVGDFAPFDRPQYMLGLLQSLKVKETADATHTAMNKGRDEILANAYRRGFAKEEQFDITPENAADMANGWSQGSSLTSADAFYHYYAQFTRDQNYLEAHIDQLKTPLKVVWGERDFYIKPDMGAEFAKRTNSEFELLPGLGHYLHLQRPSKVVDEVRALFADQP
jgi:pimeloyl-ACP methyl ester carboxylesterase